MSLTTLFLASILMVLVACQEENTPMDSDAKPQHSFCYSCVVKDKEITNETKCTVDTFTSRTGIRCNSKQYCYTEILRPVEGNDEDILLKRGCTPYYINACLFVMTKEDGNYTKCVKTCNQDQCNTENFINFTVYADPDATCTGGNGSMGMKMGGGLAFFAALFLALLNVI
ncbi:uncharacterized protein LOC120330095 [Styela clava]|uniref:uncharacterized protein LOC120330095 n=1 Tax=Styela clava TaxID=7725 RepID=UPI001939BDF9|nr:uncharacterized protein LOC120330095 [Styela clava]